jgi:nucleoside-specific outer membrane channel protein Tsx
MKEGITIKLSLLIVVYCFVSCTAFKYGYTEDKALNAYYIVNGNKNNFGDQRIKYNEYFHPCPCFKNFLSSRGYPGFIYEYKTNTKCKGIKLFYPITDSVFVFEEAKKNKRYSFIKESRKMDDYERETYRRLKADSL